MDCNVVRRQFSAMLDGELDGAIQAAVADHLKVCPACFQEWEQLAALDQAIESLFAPLPPGIPEAVVARIQPRHRSGWQSLALAASLVLGISLGGTMAHKFYPFLTPNGTGTEVAALETFNDFPQGSLGTILASYQPEEGNGK